MRRTTRLALLTALLAAALPALPATACSPAIPTIDLARDVVVPGGTVGVSGEATDAKFTCDVPTAPTPEPSIEITEEPLPAESESPTPFPLPTTPLPLPTLRLVAYEVPDTTVTFELVPATDFFTENGPSRVVGSAAATTAPGAEGATLYRFAARVRIPADVTPGSYRLSAHTGKAVFYGYGMVRVVTDLPATGAPALVPLGGLLALCAAAALTAARRVTG